MFSLFHISIFLALTVLSVDLISDDGVSSLRALHLTHHFSGTQEKILKSNMLFPNFGNPPSQFIVFGYPSLLQESLWLCLVYYQHIGKENLSFVIIPSPNKSMSLSPKYLPLFVAREQSAIC